MFPNGLIKKIAIKLGVLIYNVNADIANVTLPKFGNIPKNVKIELPRRIINPGYIFLGDDVSLGPGSLLNAITHYPPVSWLHSGKHIDVREYLPKITIGNRVTSTADLQIGAMSEVTIEDDVMFASNINITDGSHGYENANEPYKYQEIVKLAPVRIKRGCWIGQNVVILSGCTIGELSIIGANSVVAKSIPDRCIAVGTPAKVIKKWDESIQKWVLIDDEHS